MMMWMRCLLIENRMPITVQDCGCVSNALIFKHQQYPIIPLMQLHHGPAAPDQVRQVHADDLVEENNGLQRWVEANIAINPIPTEGVAHFGTSEPPRLHDW
jgi:hypothetical protein